MGVFVHRLQIAEKKKGEKRAQRLCSALNVQAHSWETSGAKPKQAESDPPGWGVGWEGFREELALVWRARSFPSIRTLVLLAQPSFSTHRPLRFQSFGFSTVACRATSSYYRFGFSREDKIIPASS